MIDRMGEGAPAAVGPGLCDRLVEQAAGGADEGPALYILLIARLFAHQHDARRRRPLAPHPLRRVAVERAAGATVDRADKGVPRLERSGGARQARKSGAWGKRGAGQVDRGGSGWL